MSSVTNTNNTPHSIMNVTEYFQLLAQYEAATTEEDKKLILAQIDKLQEDTSQQLLTED